MVCQILWQSRLTIFQTTQGMVRRRFSVCPSQYGSVKAKLQYFTNTEKLALLSKKERLQKEEKYEREKKLASLKPYSEQKFNHLVKKISGEDRLNYKDEDIPLEHIETLQKANRRMMFTYLGVDGLQLKDSYVVEEKTIKFLKKGHDNKALLLCKMAGENGVVGMNHILESLVQQQNYNMAIKLMNYRKKWGVPCNEHTYTILFKGFAESRTPLTRKQVDKLYGIYKNLEKLYRQRNLLENKTKEPIALSNIHINSALSALTYTAEENQEYAWDVFKSLAATGPHSANSISFTIMLNSFRNIKDKEFIDDKLESLLKSLTDKVLSSHNNPNPHAMRFKVDLKLLSGFANAAARIKDDEKKFVVYRFIQKFVGLEKYDLESVVPQDMIDIKDFHIKEFLKVYNKKAKLIPTRQLLTSLVNLFSSLETFNSDQVFQNIVYNNPKVIDFVFLKQWVTYKARTSKITHVGTLVHAEYKKLSSLVKDKLKTAGNADFLREFLTNDEKRYFLTELYKAYATQIYNVNKQIFNSKILARDLNAAELAKSKEKKLEYNLRMCDSINSCFCPNNQLDLWMLYPQDDLVIKWENLAVFHSYLSALFNLEVTQAQYSEILGHCICFLKNNEIHQILQENSFSFLTKSELLSLKGVLMNTVRYIQIRIQSLAIEKKVNPGSKLYSQIEERKRYLRLKTAIVDAVSIIEQMMRGSRAGTR